MLVLWGDQSKSLRVLIDSGADESFMDVTIALELGIPTQPLSVPLDARALDGRSIGEVIHSTVPVQLQVSGDHSEPIHFLLIASPHVPVVLGFSWLQKHNPVIDWTTSSTSGSVLFSVRTRDQSYGGVYRGVSSHWGRLLLHLLPA